MCPIFRSVFILSMFIATGCASMADYKTHADSNGIYRVSHRSSERPNTETVSAPEGALRNQDGKLIWSKDEAKGRFESIKAPGDLTDVLSPQVCNVDVVYKANLAQKSALQKIKERNFQGAHDDLNKAAEICPRLGWISVQYYLEAVTAIEMNQLDVARAKLDEFLNYTSAAEPSAYNVFDSFDGAAREQGIKHDQAELAFYRENARKYLAGQQAALPLSDSDLGAKEAMMYPNNLFRPGGSQTPMFLVLPALGYSSLSGAVYGVTVYKSWGRFSIAPSFFSAGDFGTTYSVRVRRLLYESSNRDFNVDVFGYAGTWREVSYSQAVYGGPATNVRVLRQGTNYGAGFGATKRFFIPSFGVSVQMMGENNQVLSEMKTYGSLYAFYDFTRGIDVFSGWVRNQPVAGVSIAFVKIAYGISNGSVVTFIDGLSF